jgi:SAM-dependent methyltransferase
MSEPHPPQFSDGDAYERMMGRWSQVAGEIFIDWVAPKPGLSWLDIGCGNGAFTELLVKRCAPSRVQAIDPSEGLLATARKRLADEAVEIRQGSAQALPYDDDAFDAATMALVINFLPEPDKAVSEMARVVRGGGSVSTYVWDIAGGGFTMEPIREALNQMGVPSPIPGAEITQIKNLRRAWERAGLNDVDTIRIDISLTYEDFDDFWDANTAIPNSVSNTVRTLSLADVETLKQRLRETLPTNQQGQIFYGAHVNAVKGFAY